MEPSGWRHNVCWEVCSKVTQSQLVILVEVNVGGRPKDISLVSQNMSALHALKKKNISCHRLLAWGPSENCTVCSGCLVLYWSSWLHMYECTNIKKGLTIAQGWYLIRGTFTNTYPNYHTPTQSKCKNNCKSVCKLNTVHINKGINAPKRSFLSKHLFDHTGITAAMCVMCHERSE